MRYKTRHGRLGGPGILSLTIFLPLFLPFFILNRLLKLARWAAWQRR